MTNFFVNNVWTIIFLPIWVFFIIILMSNTFINTSKKVTTAITLASTFIGIVFSSGILAHCIINQGTNIESNIDWLQINNINFSMGYLIDNLSATMLLVVTTVSFLVQLYSYEYMNKDSGFHRFFAYLNLFNFSMLGLVVSTNLFQTYVFWELVGVSSYLLIGFWYKRPSASNAAIKAFLTNRIGDISLLCGIIAFFYYSMSFWVNNAVTTLGFSQIEKVTTIITQSHGLYIITLIGCAIFVGAMAKSAQFPLHIWLPDAMEGPTPISALIHAATMVAAGVYLVARVYPILDISPYTMNFITLIGLTTALTTAIIAISQNDIKKVLAYSTCSQLGYMFVAMGVGAYSAGIFHLVTHAYFKAMLFLCAGSVIHSLQDQQDMRYMGGLRKKSPITAICYLIGAFSISGLFLSGFHSKEAIFSGIYSSNKYLLLALSIIIAGLTSFYMFKSYFMVFEGDYKGHTHFHKPSKIITIPLIIFSIPSAFLGLYLSNIDFLNFIHLTKHNTENVIIPVISILTALTGLLIAGFMYNNSFKKLINICPESELNKIQTLYTLSSNKFYVDDFVNAMVKNIFKPFAYLLAIWDKLVIDGIVNMFALCAQFKGFILSKTQTGVLGTYTVISVGLTAMLIVIVSLLWICFNLLRF